MKRAREVKGRQGGQPDISLKVRREIQGRLRTLKKSCAAAGTDEAFSQAIGVSRSTVSAWFNAKPKTPGTPHVLSMAEELKVQPTWILLGEGPEKRGATVPEGDLAEQLHAHVLGVLTHEFRTPKKFVKGCLPSPADMFRDLMQQYRASVGETVEEARRIEQSVRKHAERLATPPGHKPPDEPSIYQALYDMTLHRHRKLADLGPVNLPPRLAPVGAVFTGSTSR